MTKKKYYRTKRCIICLKKADCISGHVIKDGESIFAGWCEKHVGVYIKTKDNKYVFIANSNGCYGGWIPEFGLKEIKF